MLISVIVPIYKVEKFLRRCIDSIIHQTYKNLEIILVDDGSPDKCPQICDEYARQDKRIKVIHKTNGGLSSARNAGLDIVKGELIYFIDSDDYIESQTLQILVDNMNDNDLVIFGYAKEYPDKILVDDLSKIVNLNSQEQLRVLMSNWSFGFVWNKLYRKSIITEKFNFVPREDLDFNARVFKNVQKFQIIPGALYHYVQQENSITHKVQKISFESLVDCHNNMLEFLREKKYDKLIPYQNTAFLKSLINIFKYDKFEKKNNNKIKHNYNYIYNSECVKQALKNYKCNNFREKIFILLIKLKMIKILQKLI